ncbi:hypothetical protein_gp163 [Bacillus phage vB_BceM_WH1]|nr:hypothetical protein_gp163 [Bacillus phage vB_BceM_WH1]
MARLLIMILLGMLLLLEFNGLMKERYYIIFICYFTFFIAFGVNKEVKK